MFSASQSTSFSISITHTHTSKLGHTVLCVLHLISWKQNIKLKAKYWSSCAQKIGNFPLFLGHPIHFVDLVYICPKGHCECSAASIASAWGVRIFLIMTNQNLYSESLLLMQKVIHVLFKSSIDNWLLGCWGQTCGDSQRWRHWTHRWWILQQRRIYVCSLWDQVQYRERGRWMFVHLWPGLDLIL